MTQDPRRRMLHPELSPEARRRLFLRGIELFNSGDWFDCHEAFEEIWRSTTPEPRDLFQGLIQVAVGFFHLQVRGNRTVARRVLAKGRRRLVAFVPLSHGLDVGGLVEGVRRWERWLEEAGEAGAAGSGEGPEVPRIVVVDSAAVR